MGLRVKVKEIVNPADFTAFLEEAFVNGEHQYRNHRRQPYYIGKGYERGNDQYQVAAPSLLVRKQQSDMPEGE